MKTKIETIERITILCKTFEEVESIHEEYKAVAYTFEIYTDRHAEYCYTVTLERVVEQKRGGDNKREDHE